MEVTTPLFEDILIYIGHLVCLLAAVYMAKIGQVKIGLLFLIAFILQIQVGYVVANIESNAEAQGSCWAMGGTYYDCLPIVHRISVHAAQVGIILLGMAVFLSARKLVKHNV
jgi:hypothetical protein